MMHVASEAATEQIVWSEGFATGIAAVDQQHRTMLELLNKVRVLVADQRHHDQQQHLGALLDLLNELASAHFRAEEALLRQHLSKQPGTAAHIQAHRSYWSAITGYQRQLRYGDPELYEELYRFLRQWWIGHILTAYQEMGAALRALEIRANGQGRREPPCEEPRSTAWGSQSSASSAGS